MEVREAMQIRRSVRKYTDEKVSREEIDCLLHAAMSGPSAVNKKPWDFYVVEEEETLEKLRKATKFSNMNAPLAIIVVGNLKKALPLGAAAYWIQDCSAATENILLQAVELGLGTVWCGVHPQKGNEKHVREALGLSDKMVPLNIIWVGHPAETPEKGDQYDEKCVHFI